MDKYKMLIEDDRLNTELARIRNGETQEFYKKGDIGVSNCLLFKLVSSNKGMYAKLIAGKWYWVKCCSKCKDSMNYGEAYSYQVCDEHNRCVRCNAHRRDVKGTVWGHKYGFMCQECMNLNNEKRRKDAFEKLNNTGYNSDDYLHGDDILCPHCGSEQSSDDVDDGEYICDICDGKYKLSVDYTVDYSTCVCGERLTE